MVVVPIFVYYSRPDESEKLMKSLEITQEDIDNYLKNVLRKTYQQYQDENIEPLIDHYVENDYYLDVINPPKHFKPRREGIHYTNQISRVQNLKKKLIYEVKSYQNSN